MAGLEEEPSWDAVLAVEPGERTCLTDEQFDTACRAIADFTELLFISEKTVSHHTQHIYTKIGVSTRAGATLFAMQYDLLADVG